MTDELSSEQRAARLRPLVERALESYELSSPTIELITNDWNCVFRVDDATGSRHVLRVSLPDRRTLDEVRGEMAWLAALAAETELAVPTPLATRDGSLVVSVEHEEVPEPRACVVFGWIDGIPLIDALTEATVEALGATAARLHEHALRFPVQPGLRVWNSPYPFGEPEVLFGEEHAAALEAAGRTPFERAKTATLEAIDRLGEAEPARLVHADLHEENAFVRSDGSIAILDFDDCMIGWPAQDLGITVFGLAGRDVFEPLEAALRRGYEQVAPWPEPFPGAVRTFAADRCLMLANHVVQDHDPEYRAAAPRYVAEWAAKIERLLG